MTKDDIVDELHKKIDMTKKETETLVNAIFDQIAGALMNKQPVKITNFGNFNLRNKNERVGRNPKTGEEATISARTVVTFKPSTHLKDVVNVPEGAEKPKTENKKPQSRASKSNKVSKANKANETNEVSAVKKSGKKLKKKVEKVEVEAKDGNEPN